MKAEITEYEFGKKYVSIFKFFELDVKIAYYLEDNDHSCQIASKENVPSFDEKEYSNLGTWFYSWQLKQGAKKRLKQMKSNVLVYVE